MPGLDNVTQTQVSSWMNSTPGTPILDTVLNKPIDQVSFHICDLVINISINRDFVAFNFLLYF